MAITRGQVKDVQDSGPVEVEADFSGKGYPGGGNIKHNMKRYRMKSLLYSRRLYPRF